MLKKLMQMRVSSIAGVILILVVFPLGALYYMNMGLKWRKERLGELKTYSRLSEAQLHAAYDTLATLFLDDQNIIITSFINPDNKELAGRYGENLRKLHAQFDARGDVFFVMHLYGDSTTRAAFLPGFIRQYELEDTAQCLFFWQREEEAAAMAREAYQLERADGESWNDSPYFALVDSATVRHYYDVRQPQAIKRLVEHIAILIPPSKEREDLVFKRETEK